MNKKLIPFLRELKDLMKKHNVELDAYESYHDVSIVFNNLFYIFFF